MLLLKINKFFKLYFYYIILIFDLFIKFKIKNGNVIIYYIFFKNIDNLY